MLFKISCLSTLVLFCFSSAAEAKKVKYYFDGTSFDKEESVHGKIEGAIYCENKISLEELGLYKRTVDEGYDEIYVSPDERYFVFGGAESRHSRWQYFLVDKNDCKVIKELTIDEKYDIAQYYYAAFSPDSKKLYVSWDVLETGKDTEYRSLTKEYSGDGFKDEKELKNIVIPSRSSYQDYWVYTHKFSKDGEYFISLATDYELSIYKISEDSKITSLKIENYLDEKYYISEYVPDITKDYLIYSFERDTGTEMNVFDYINKTLKKKIEVSSKQGVGMFSTNGNRVIFSSFANTKTWKKDIIVYDRDTGNQIGKTTLDEKAEIKDVSSDDKQIIYTEDGVEKRAKLQRSQ